MGWDLMLHLDRDGNEPPPCTRRNDSTHDLALESERFGHIDRPKLGDAYRLPIHSKFVVSKIEAQPVPFLAFEVRKTAFLSILAWMFELGQRSFLFHPPIVSKRLPQIGKLLFGSAFRDLRAPGELFALDAVVFCLEVFHLGPFPLYTILFPASKRPVIGVTSTTTGFAKIHLLLWCGIQSNDVRAIHGYFFSCLIVRSNSASRSRSKTESIVSCCKAAIALSLRKLSRLILVVTTSCFIDVFYNTFTPCVKQEKYAQDEHL